MQRVERILIRPGNTNYQAAHRSCQMVRALKNQAQFRARQDFFSGSHPKHRAIDKQLKQEKAACYSRLPAAMAQRTTQIVGQEWSSYYEALKAWKVTPEKFKAKPKPPGYARSAATVTVGRNGFCIVDGKLAFGRNALLGFQPVTVLCCQQQAFNAPADAIAREVRIVPHGNCFWLELVYDAHHQLVQRPRHEERVPPFSVLLDKRNVLACDLGLENLIAVVSNQPDVRPALVKGRVLKALNAKYNREVAQLRSHGKGDHIGAKAVKRHNQITDYLHKVSHWLIQHCLATNSGTLIVGYNEGWKDGINIGRKNNQKFVCIPHARLLAQLQYKGAAYGIDVIPQEESYTSQASALDGDAVPTYDPERKDKPVFSGRRVKRGLYRSGNERLLNADVNAALNIMRKAQGICEARLAELVDKGCVFQPRVVICYREDKPKVYALRRIAKLSTSAANQPFTTEVA